MICNLSERLPVIPLVSIFFTDVVFAVKSGIIVRTIEQTEGIHYEE